MDDSLNHTHLLLTARKQSLIREFCPRSCSPKDSCAVGPLPTSLSLVVSPFRQFLQSSALVAWVSRLLPNWAATSHAMVYPADLCGVRPVTCQRQGTSRSHIHVGSGTV